jgi:ADP-L-glycero-D-manno-heptose 6-epimerase
MIVVTGANGFIGSVLVRDLNARGRTDIICVDTVTPQERSAPLSKAQYQHFVHTNDLKAWLADQPGRVEVIFHMGACSSTTEKNWDYLYSNNTLYTQHLFEFCTQHRIPFYYASSAAVYGGGEKGFDDATSTDQFKPLNLYGKSKWMFDIWASEQKETPLHWGGFRFFNVYGPNEYHKGDMASVVYKAYQQISQSGSLKLFKSYRKEYGDGEQLRDFVYVKDVTRWMIEFWKNPKATPGIYNMGFGTARSWVDLAKATFAAMDKPVKIDWIEMPADIRDQYQYYTKAEMQRLFAQKVSVPMFSLESGVHDYVKEYLSQKDPNL